MILFSSLTNQNPLNADGIAARQKRQFFNDYDGGIFYDGNYLGRQNTEAVQDRQLNSFEYYKPRRIKTDPDFDRRLAQLQDTFSFSPFLRAYVKYFVRNREQKRERREVDDESYYENRENGVNDDYYAQEEYEERHHHFHPIPVFWENFYLVFLGFVIDFCAVDWSFYFFRLKYLFFVKFE